MFAGKVLLTAALAGCWLVRRGRPTGRRGNLGRLWSGARVPLLLVLALIFLRCTDPGVPPPRLGAQTLRLSPGGRTPAASQDLVRRAQEDPIAVLEAGLKRYDSQVRSYAGIFVIQERIDGRLNDRVATRFRFRSRPFSVAMRHLRGKARVTRLLYVAGQHNGQMIVRPSGLLGKLASGIEVDPHGARARKGSLRAITDFGLRKTLIRLLKAYKQAAEQKQLKSRCLGIGRLDGRPSLTLQKVGPAGKTVVDLDADLLLPLRVQIYAPNHRLLAYYQYKSLRFNCGLTDSDFSREANGL